MKKAERMALVPHIVELESLLPKFYNIGSVVGSLYMALPEKEQEALMEEYIIFKNDLSRTGKFTQSIRDHFQPLVISDFSARSEYWKLMRGGR